MFLPPGHGGETAAGTRTMKLSMRTDYALRALFHLVGTQGQGPVPLAALAERNDVPRKFLEQIMLDLKAQGWVASVAGRNGGYLLAQDPRKITMGQVVRHFDGVLAPIACVSTTHHEECSQSGSCRFRRVLLDLRNHTAAVMDAATLAQVHAAAPVQRAEVFAADFVDGAGI
jgi:Rrf2 family protein